MSFKEQLRNLTEAGAIRSAHDAVEQAKAKKLSEKEARRARVRELITGLEENALMRANLGQSNAKIQIKNYEYDRTDRSSPVGLVHEILLKRGYNPNFRKAYNGLAEETEYFLCIRWDI